MNFAFVVAAVPVSLPFRLPGPSTVTPWLVIRCYWRSCANVLLLGLPMHRSVNALKDNWSVLWPSRRSYYFQHHFYTVVGWRDCDHIAEGLSKMIISTVTASENRKYCWLFKAFCQIHQWLNVLKIYQRKFVLNLASKRTLWVHLRSLKTSLHIFDRR